MPKKRKALLVTGIILGLIILIIGIFCFIQRDNISSFIDSRRYSPEELTLQLDKEKAEMQELLADYLPDFLRDLTAEEEIQLVKGEITIEEAHTKMGIDKQAEIEETVTDSNSDEASAIITKYTSRLYAIKAQFLSEIGGIASAASSAFYSLPPTERNASTKASVVSKYYAQAASLEGSCDGRVASVLNSMESELSKIGADTDVVSRLQSQYESEKSGIKAYYLGQM